MSEPRADLVDALIQSCWLVESARARLLGRWNGEFAEEAAQVSTRAELIRDILHARGTAVPDHVADAHADWIESLCGAAPTDVPLGAAVLQRLGHWSDVYVTPYAGADFAALEEVELRFPVPPRHLERAEAYLRPAEPPDGRRFVVLTDIHIGAAGTDELARRAVEEINALRPEFVVVPGDITDDGEPEQFEHVSDVLRGLEAPVHVVLGNHDAVCRSTREPVGAELFAAAYGEKPVDRVIECGPVQVVLVDSTDPTASPFPDWDLARGGFRDDAGGVNNGAFAPGQVEALAARIDPGRPALLVMHHELQPFAGFPPVMFGVREQDSEALFGALSAHRILGVVAGHTHRSALTHVGPGVAQLEVPALKDWPYTYTVMTVNEGAVHATVRQLGDTDLVWRRAEHVPPIYLNYVLGPLSALDHSFPL
jgi:predicted phosphodiesterase